MLQTISVYTAKESYHSRIQKSSSSHVLRILKQLKSAIHPRPCSSSHDLLYLLSGVVTTLYRCLGLLVVVCGLPIFSAQNFVLVSVIQNLFDLGMDASLLR